MLSNHGGSVQVKALTEELARGDPKSIYLYFRKLLQYPNEVPGKHVNFKVNGGEFLFQYVKFDSNEVSDLALIYYEELKGCYGRLKTDVLQGNP